MKIYFFTLLFLFACGTELSPMDRTLAKILHCAVSIRKTSMIKPKNNEEPVQQEPEFFPCYELIFPIIDTDLQPVPPLIVVSRDVILKYDKLDPLSKKLFTMRAPTLYIGISNYLAQQLEDSY